MGPLSNANTALLVDMARFGALPWDVVLGSDVSRAYKPDPAAYRAPAGFLGLDVGEVLLVAAHNARPQGGPARPVWQRPSSPVPTSTVPAGVNRFPDGRWDAAGASLTELARQFGVRS